MGFAIVDTNVYIGHWQHDAYAQTFPQIYAQHVLRLSAVVLSELYRGARDEEALRRVEALRRSAPVVWEPTSDDWWRAGALIRNIGDAQRWETRKRREFQNDVLIALTALRYGATVVTANRSDFQLLAKALPIALITVD